MDEKSIEVRLRLGEDSVTEFKSVVRTNFLADARDLAKSVVALANTRGGQVFVGVEDDGTPSGIGTVQQADGLMRQVSQICQDAIHPAIGCSVLKAEYRGTLLLIVDVPAFSPDRPYRAHQGYYVRDANRSREATRDELVRLLQSANYHFDEQAVDGATREDLDEGAVNGLLEALYGADFDRSKADSYLQVLKLLDSGNRPTVSGILFAGAIPTRWFPDARVSAVRFRGTTINDVFGDRQELVGRVTDQIEGAIGFLSVNLKSASHIEGWDRVGTPGPGTIPEKALREVVLNAVSHRDYRVTSQTRVFVFDDRVEVINPGILLNQLTLDSIQFGGIKQHRNPVVASLLARLLSSRRESLGIGVPEMIRAMKEVGLPPPEFDIQGGHFRVVLRARPPGTPA